MSGVERHTASRVVFYADVVEPYVQGLLEGLAMYAWWKDGTQYVGTGVITLSEAQAHVLRGHGYELKEAKREREDDDK